MWPSTKRIKFLQDDENKSSSRNIKNYPQISAQPLNDQNNQQLDLKHLAPISLEGNFYRWPEPNKFPIHKKVNKNFRGHVAKEVRSKVFSNYYRYNRYGHFVWTNQLVINGRVDLNFRPERNFPMNAFRTFSCDLENPENSFYLRRIEGFGLGLFARHDIPVGECVGEYTGELITRQEEALRQDINERRELSNYFYDTCAQNLTIDASAMGNHTRFINHSCDPNVEARSLIVEGVPRRFMVTTKRILRDQELFLHYGEVYFSGIECNCNTDKCFMPAVRLANQTFPANSWMQEYNYLQNLVKDRSQNVRENAILQNFQGQPHLRNNRMVSYEDSRMSHGNQQLRIQLKNTEFNKLPVP